MDSQSNIICSAQRLMLERNPSCVEFCPKYPSLFVVGTYNLEDGGREEENVENADDDDDGKDSGGQGTPQTRNGTLVVFEIEAGNISCLQTLVQPSAVLDLHFHPNPARHDVVAAVSSTATLSVLRLTKSDESPLSCLGVSGIAGVGENVLFLSCAWHPSHPDTMAITTSTHQVYVVRLDSQFHINQLDNEPMTQHTLEAWCVAFSLPMAPQHDPAHESRSLQQQPTPPRVFTLHSGGDDSFLRSLRCYAARLDRDDTDVSGPWPETAESWHWMADGSTLSVTRGHGAGVTAILPTPVVFATVPSGDGGGGYECGYGGSQLVLTGSYDEMLRLWAFPCGHDDHSGVGTAQRTPPQLLRECNLGGGVWRLRLVETRSRVPWLVADQDESADGDWELVVLASCMHGGARIVRITGTAAASGSECHVEVAAAFVEHKSMNYGSDYQPGQRDGPLTCVSTSFYDRLLCLWEWHG